MLLFSLSVVVWLFATPWSAACQASLSYTIPRSLPKFMSIELVLPSNHLIICHPLILLSSIFLSIRVFSNESALPIRCQSIGALASIFPMNIQDWFPLGLTGWIFMLSKGLSKVFSSITIQKHQFCGAQPSLWSNFHIHTWLLKKKHGCDYTDGYTKWCLCFLICCLGLSYLFLQGASVF